MSLAFRGPHLAFLHDETLEIDLEGALCCGKTTVALWKELEALKRWPGIWSFITRWSDDDVHTLLRPAFEQVARVHGSDLTWNSRDKAYELPNRSRCFAFGLRTTETDPLRRYGKIRGLPVSRVYVDQAEQLPADMASELRLRLRPDIEARVRGEQFPTQITFTPNPTKRWHWLATQFPDDKWPRTMDTSIPSRHYYGIGLLDNAHNLPESLIRQALLEFPPTHPKHREVILGLRPETIDWEKVTKKPFPADSAGALFEQAQREAWKYSYNI